MSEEGAEVRSGNLSQSDMSDELVEVRHRFSSLQIFKEPLWLVKNDENGVFSIVEEVLHQISQIDLTVNVIAITGPYRSGKSYLMNRLANDKSGFSVGNGVESKTKGIWAWCLMHPVFKDQVLLLLDTEGIGDAKKKDTQNDNKLLCITVLICSTFIYNLKGVIDRDTLDKLGFVTYFATNIRVGKDRTQNAFSSDIGLYLPKFVLCLRDFSHDLRGQSAIEYLESQLALQGEASDFDGHARYNQIRGCIRKFFIDRKCFIFDPPAAGRVALASLESMDEKDILKTFKDDTKVFIENIYQHLPKKLLDGKCLNGNMFTSLVKIYVHKINSGRIPCIQDALSIMAIQENKIILKRVVQKFEQEIRSIQLSICDLQGLQKIHREAQRRALREFQTNCILTIEEELFKEIAKEMDEICNKAVDKSIKFQKDACTSAVRETYNLGIKKRLKEGHYRNADGYFLFKQDIYALKAEIKRRFAQMDETLLHSALNEFENSNIDDEMMAIQMTEKHRKERKDEHEKEKQEISIRLEKRLKEQQERFQQWKKEIEIARKNEADAHERKMIEKVAEWKREKAQHELQLEMQNENIKKLLELLTEEEEASKPTAGKTIARAASSLIPVIGPLVFDVFDRKSYSERKERRSEKINTIKQNLKKNQGEDVQKK